MPNTQNNNFSGSDILKGAGDVLSGAGDVASSMKRISEQGFPVMIRIEPQTLVLFCIGVIVTATIAGAFSAFIEGAIKKAIQ